MLGLESRAQHQTDAITWIARVFPEHWYRPHVLLFGVKGPSFLGCAANLGVLAAIYLGGAILFANRRDLAK